MSGSAEPQYVIKWVGQRVQYTRERRDLRGLVIDARMRCTEEGTEILLRVARDDGFIDLGVDSRTVCILTSEA